MNKNIQLNSNVLYRTRNSFKIKLLLTIIFLFGLLSCGIAQMSISGPMGVFTDFNAPSTSILNGGKVLVGSGGNWKFTGNLKSADKGNDNAPTSTGQSEIITFDGTGDYNNSSNFIIDGYAASSNKSGSFTLPIGSGTIAYQVTVPSGVSAAYFNGIGISQTATVANNTGTNTIYSPYIDMPNGIIAGNYTFTYPAGFNATLNSSLLNSNNTSAGGTNSNTAYSLLTNVNKFSATGGNISATLKANSITQVYFASSAKVLPVTLINFSEETKNCFAKLYWQTSSEINSRSYELEYGTNGSQFNLIKIVKSSNKTTGYNYSESYPLANGSNYFRLKMVDNDGDYTYSKTLSITANQSCAAGVLVKVLPNPANDFITVQGVGLGNHIVLSDINSRKLLTLVSTGNNQLIDISKFANGMYFLQVTNESGIINITKVVKQ